jgi:hypothetical protein
MIPRLLRVVSASAGAALVLACTVIDQQTQCQIYAPDDAWVSRGLHVEVIAPSNRQCPLSLDFFRQSIDYAADIDAPNGTTAEGGQVNTSIWDVNNTRTGTSLGYFFVGSDGRMHANDQGFYFAGNAGATTKLQQDRADTYVTLVGGGTATNSIYLPYTCCNGQAVTFAIAGALPRAKRGTTVTVRTWNNFMWTKFRWYLNGVEILVAPPGGGLGNPVPPGGIYSRAMNTIGTYTWKIRIQGSRPGEDKLLTFPMVIY